MSRILFLLAIVLAASAFQIDTYLAVDPQQCIQEKCPTQWAACQKDPKCIPALQDCEKKCGSKNSCWTLCLPSKGSQAAVDTAKCASANKCVGEIPSTAVAIASPQECIETKCRDQLQSCAKDPKCFAALQDCDKECGESVSCYTTCLAKKGNANATGFWKCILDNDCLNAVESTAVAPLSDPLPCIKEKCPTQWAACEKDPKCLPALDACDKKCGTKVSCWTLCLPSKGSQAAIDTAKCAQANGCIEPTIFSMIQKIAMFSDPQECIMKYCKSQEEACANDRRCILVMDECDNQCNTNFTCWNSCLARRGNKNASDYFKCIIDNQCYKATEEITALALSVDPMQCIQDKCPTQYAACKKDPKCVPALQDCQKKCGTKTSCWTFCLPGKGSQAAIDTAKCASANGCVGMIPSTAVALATPMECIESKCKDQLHTCAKDSKCFPALQDCEKECGNNTSCYSNCLAKKGNANATNLWKCILDNDCLNAVESTAVAPLSDPLPCIKEKCPTQWAACEKDPKCLPALEECDKKCGTKVSCWTLCLPSKGNQAAIDTAKCAQTNGCMGMVPPFESCMMRSCGKQHQECLANWSCRQSIRKCRTGAAEYDFDHDCLFAEAKETGFLSEWYHCAGGHFCI